MTKKLALFLCAIAFLVGIGAQAQNGFLTTAPPPATIAGCALPGPPNVFVQGTAPCIYGTATAPGLGISVNGGSFFAVPMGAAQTITVTAPLVLTTTANGIVISCPTCITSAVTSLNGKSGALNLSATTTAPTVTVTLQ